MPRRCARVPVRPSTSWPRFAEPRDAVVRSWLALEDAAEASGAPRRPADSPTEFTGQVLRSTAADPEAVTRLLNLYHRARFSDHTVGMAEVKQARAAVLSLCRTWAGYEDALRSSVHLRHSVRQSSSVRTGPASRR